eukprot:1157153-Pelagomonas_calceolata.AAC.9
MADLVLLEPGTSVFSGGEIRVVSQFRSRHECAWRSYPLEMSRAMQWMHTWAASINPATFPSVACVPTTANPHKKHPLATWTGKKALCTSASCT